MLPLSDLKVWGLVSFPDPTLNFWEVGTEGKVWERDCFHRRTKLINPVTFCPVPHCVRELLAREEFNYCAVLNITFAHTSVEKAWLAVVLTI